MPISNTLVPPARNFLNWGDSAPLDQPVYRIMPLSRLEQTCHTGENGLVRPRKWEDPFENFLFSAVALDGDGNRVGFGWRDDLYGQCWTDADETDAMWRIYSPKKEGVRVRSTPRRLLSGLYRSQGRFRDLSCFIGKVQYLSQDAICSALRDPEFVKAAAFDSSGINQCQTLLFKRRAFIHESEVRLIYMRPSTERSVGDVFAYPLDAVSMFDELVLDPRLTDGEATAHTDRLKQLGFCCEIRHSTLYRLPKMFARLS